ncbi:fluoride efflux transporter CrcB [Sulfobacillus sp. hq2]|nr:fluoride efflux transporter CrcB [Sulfobacillus sp. hq2]
MALVWVFLGGFVGAVARFEAGQWIGQRTIGPFPWGTFSINTVGSLFIGLLFARPLAPPLLNLLDVGFTGAFTTFSTFSYETLRLMEEKLYRTAFLNAAVSLATGLGAVALGISIGRGMGI